MGSLVPLAQTTKLVSRPTPRALTTPRQFDLVLDDVRLSGMTSAQRQAALRSLARLLLEAGGVAIQEAGDDHA
jgi:hypothetical protein